MKKVENSVANGEIVLHEQFLLLPQCIKILSAAEASESVYMWKKVSIWLMERVNCPEYFIGNFTEGVGKFFKLLRTKYMEQYPIACQKNDKKTLKTTYLS